MSNFMLIFALDVKNRFLCHPTRFTGLQLIVKCKNAVTPAGDRISASF